MRMIGQPLIDIEGIEGLEPVLSAETTTAAVRDEYGRNLWKRDSLEPLQRNFSGPTSSYKVLPQTRAKGEGSRQGLEASEVISVIASG